MAGKARAAIAPYGVELFMALFFALACGMSAWARDVSMADGLVWVRWPAWSGAIERAAEAKGAGHGIEWAADQRVAATRLAAKWDNALSGSGKDAWRSATPGQLLDQLSPQELDACFKAGQCARLSAQWLQTLFAQSGLVGVKWEPTFGAASAQVALSEQDLRQIGLLTRAPHGWFAWTGAAVGLAIGLAWALALRATRERVLEKTPQGEADLSWSVAVVHVARCAAFAVAGGLAMALVMLALVFAMSRATRWVAPMSADQALAMAADPGMALGALDQKATGEEWMDLVLQPERAGAKSVAEGLAARAACERSGLCFGRRPISLSDLGRELLGRGPSPGETDAAPAGAEERQAVREAVARRQEAQTTVGMLVFSALVMFGVSSYCAAESARDYCQDLREKMLAWGTRGRPIEERRVLRSQATRAAKIARRKRKSQGDAAPAPAKKGAQRL
jgi:hypothetical protein